MVFRSSPRVVLESFNFLPETDSSLWLIAGVTFVLVYVVSQVFHAGVSQFYNQLRSIFSNWSRRAPDRSRHDAAHFPSRPLFRGDSRKLELNSGALIAGRRRREPFHTLSEVQAALRKTGLESSHLILGIDFTKSNTWTGAATFGGRCLHDTAHTGFENPYQRVMRVISRTLAGYDEDSLIPAFGFGDIHTKGNSCFPFFPDRPCNGLQEVLDRYNEIVGGIQLSGPTNFAPVINKAVEIVKLTRDYHILLIIADGQVDKVKDTVDAIVAASHHPLSIVCVGVGDGPWDTMEHFDDQIPQRRFDNFQFVNMRALEAAHASAGVERLEAEFACAALMELPEQYAAMRRLSIL